MSAYQRENVKTIIYMPDDMLRGRWSDLDMIESDPQLAEAFMPDAMCS